MASELELLLGKYHTATAEWLDAIEAGDNDGRQSHAAERVNYGRELVGQKIALLAKQGDQRRAWVIGTVKSVLKGTATVDAHGVEYEGDACSMALPTAVSEEPCHEARPFLLVNFDGSPLVALDCRHCVKMRDKIVEWYSDNYAIDRKRISTAWIDVLMVSEQLKKDLGI